MERKQSAAEIERTYKLIEGSKKHNTRWKKGQSGNPKGHMAISGPLKMASRVVILDIFERCAQITEREADERLKDESLSLVEKAMITAIKHDIKHGNLYAIDRICDRILGKPKESMSLENKSSVLKIEFVNEADNAGNEDTKDI